MKKGLQCILFEHSSAAQQSNESNMNENRDFTKKVCILKSAILITPLAVDCLGFIISSFIAKLNPTFSNTDNSYIAELMSVQLRLNLVDANFLFTNSLKVSKSTL